MALRLSLANIPTRANLRVQFPVIREMSAKSRSFRRGLEFRDAVAKAMNNVYCRFVRLASHQDPAKMPAMLRMNVIASPGVPMIDSELWSAMSPFVRRSRFAVLLAAIRHRFSRVRSGKIA